MKDFIIADEAIIIKVFWYQGKNGRKYGTLSEFKRNKMAEQIHSVAIGVTTLDDPEIHLIGNEWI